MQEDLKPLLFDFKLNTLKLEYLFTGITIFQANFVLEYYYIIKVMQIKLSNILNKAQLSFYLISCKVEKNF